MLKISRGEKSPNANEEKRNYLDIHPLLFLNTEVVGITLFYHFHFLCPTLEKGKPTLPSLGPNISL